MSRLFVSSVTPCFHRRTFPFTAGKTIHKSINSVDQCTLYLFCSQHSVEFSVFRRIFKTTWNVLFLSVDNSGDYDYSRKNRELNTYTHQINSCFLTRSVWVANTHLRTWNWMSLSRPMLKWSFIKFFLLVQPGGTVYVTIYFERLEEKKQIAHMDQR